MAQDGQEQWEEIERLKGEMSVLRFKVNWLQNRVEQQDRHLTRLKHGLKGGRVDAEMRELMGLGSSLRAAIWASNEA